jgi:hypothetical protein
VKIKIIEDQLREYAFNYYHREIHDKQNPNNRRAWAAIQADDDPITWMRKPKEDEGHPYKIPRAENDLVVIASLDTQEEVERLIQKVDNWVNTRGLSAHDLGLKPDSYERLGDLATMFRNRGYFTQHYDAKNHQPQHTQLRCYHEWKARRSLEGVLKGVNKPCIQYCPSGEYHILDGWGRLLPFMALLQEGGFEFHPIEAFVAAPSRMIGSQRLQAGWHA